MRVSIDFTDSEIATIKEWQLNYLSPDMPNDFNGAVRDMVRRLSDDMNEMLLTNEHEVGRMT